MGRWVGHPFREAVSPVGRIRIALFPRRVRGWRAAFLILGIVLLVLLASDLLWLAIVPSKTSWKLVAFSAVYFSFGLWALAPLVPERFCRVVVCVGAAATVASVIWVQFASGA